MATRLIAYDTTRRRPGCVNVAAALGADTDLPQLFPDDWWLTYPTPEMKVFPVTDEQVAALLKMTPTP